jgi:hypothetical protein
MFTNLIFYPSLNIIVHTINLLFIKVNLKSTIKQLNFISKITIIYVTNSLKFRYSKFLSVPLLSMILFFETFPIFFKFKTYYRSHKLIELGIIKFRIKTKKKILFFLNEFYIYFIYISVKYIFNLILFTNLKFLNLLIIKFILNLNNFSNYNVFFSDIFLATGLVEIYFKSEFYNYISKDIKIFYNRIILNFIKKLIYYVR